MNRILFDFETTGICSYNCEPITAFFENIDTGETHFFKSKVDNWSEEAAEIHKISYEEMMTYDDNEVAWKKLIDFLPEEFEGIFYANPNASQLYGALENGVKHEVYFDKSVLVMNLMEHLDIYHPCNLPFKIKFTSVYDMAKEADRLKVFTAIPKEGSRVKNFSQEMVYFALFGEKYNAHDAKTDTKILIKIYERLNYLLYNNKRSSNQMDFLT